MNHTQLLLPDGCILPAGGHHGRHAPPRAASATHAPRGSQRAPCPALASLRGGSRRWMSATTFKRQQGNGFTVYVTLSGRCGPRPPRALPSETDRTNPEGGHCSLSPSTELSTGSVPAQEGLSTQKCPRFSSFKGILLGQRTQGRALGMLGRHELSLSRPRRGPGWSAPDERAARKGEGLLRARQGRQAHQGGTGGGSVADSCGSFLGCSTATDLCAVAAGRSDQRGTRTEARPGVQAGRVHSAEAASPAGTLPSGRRCKTCSSSAFEPLLFTWCFHFCC